eukprot:2751071-Pleurochrysis_carterae.AAC.1
MGDAAAGAPAAPAHTAPPHMTAPHGAREEGGQAPTPAGAGRFPVGTTGRCGGSAAAQEGGRTGAPDPPLAGANVGGG